MAKQTAERRIEYISIDDIKRADVNPKRHHDETIRQSYNRHRVDVWRQRPNKRFPEPRWIVGGRPCWDWVEIKTWAIDHGLLAE